MSKYGHRPFNWFEAIVNKLGGEDAAERFLRDELIVSEPTRSWREENGVIYFSVTSDGTTGEGWIARLESKGFRLSDFAKRILRSPDFKLTSGVRTEVVILKGILFEDDNRTTSKIRDMATQRNLTKPNAEVACLIREKFTDREIEQMGLIWIITMHEPIKDSDSGLYLSGAGRDDSGRWLHLYCGYPGRGWYREHGFAFAVSPTSPIERGEQVGPQN